MSTAGSPISVFNDLMRGTGPTIYTGVDEFINETVLRSYAIGKFMPEEDMGELIQGSPKIRDYIIAEEANTFVDFHPNAVFSWQNPQVQKDWEIEWRYSMDHMAWNDHELIHQMGDASRLTAKARFQVYKDVKKGKEVRLQTSIQNGLERALFAVPDATQMEAADGLKVFSLWALVNEETNGLYPGFDTLQGIDPTEYDFWVPNQITYDYDNYLGTNARNGLYNAFDRMRIRMNWRRPPRAGSIAGERYNKNRFIMTGEEGLLLYEDALRKSNDFLRSGNGKDPSYEGAQYRGYEIMEFQQFDSSPVFAGGGGTTRVTQMAADSPGPRFIWINAEYVRMVWHRERYFYAHEIMQHPNQPGAWRKPIELWRNMFVRSRRKGTGIIYPDAPSS